VSAACLRVIRGCACKHKGSGRLPRRRSNSCVCLYRHKHSHAQEAADERIIIIENQYRRQSFIFDAPWGGKRRRVNNAKYSQDKRRQPTNWRRTLIITHAFVPKLLRDNVETGSWKPIKWRWRQIRLECRIYDCSREILFSILKCRMLLKLKFLNRKLCTLQGLLWDFIKLFYMMYKWQRSQNDWRIKFQ
jgi:hypothetical protein